MLLQLVKPDQSSRPMLYQLHMSNAVYRSGVGNLSLVGGPKQTLQGMPGRINFPPTIPFFLQFMMSLKLANVWNFNHSS